MLGPRFSEWATAYTWGITVRQGGKSIASRRSHGRQRCRRLDVAFHLADAAVGSGERVEPEDAAFSVEENGGRSHVDGEGLQLGVGHDVDGQSGGERGAQSADGREEF